MVKKKVNPNDFLTYVEIVPDKEKPQHSSEYGNIVKCFLESGKAQAQIDYMAMFKNHKELPKQPLVAALSGFRQRISGTKKQPSQYKNKVHIEQRKKDLYIVSGSSKKD